MAVAGRSTASSRSPRRSGGGGGFSGSGGLPRRRPRSWSGSAGRPTTRGSWPRSSPIPTPAPRSCCGRRTPCWSRSTRCRTRATSARSPARPRRPARPGWSSPSAARPQVTAVACKASAGAVEHLPIAHVRNLADWLGEAKQAGLLDLGRRRRGEAGALGRRPERADGARPRRRGQGPAPPRRLGLRRARRPAAAGQDRLAQRLGGRRGAALRGRSAAASNCNGDLHELRVRG